MLLREEGVRASQRGGPPVHRGPGGSPTRLSDPVLTFSGTSPVDDHRQSSDSARHLRVMNMAETHNAMTPGTTTATYAIFGASRRAAA